MLTYIFTKKNLKRFFNKLLLDPHFLVISFQVWKKSRKLKARVSPILRSIIPMKNSQRSSLTRRTVGHHPLSSGFCVNSDAQFFAQQSTISSKSASDLDNVPSQKSTNKYTTKDTYVTQNPIRICLALILNEIFPLHLQSSALIGIHF